MSDTLTLYYYEGNESSSAASFPSSSPSQSDTRQAMIMMRSTAVNADCGGSVRHLEHRLEHQRYFIERNYKNINSERNTISNISHPESRVILTPEAKRTERDTDINIALLCLMLKQLLCHGVMVHSAKSQ